LSGIDIILTGLPRSGTNLTCTLLNKVEDTVALSEPMDVVELARAGNRAAHVRKFMHQQRTSLHENGTALTKHRGGKVRDNFFSDAANHDGLRHSKSVCEYISIGKNLSSEFNLAVKHPSVFSALLPELNAEFPCYALVRNPISVLGSWNANKMAVRDGRAPAAENVDTALRRKLDGTKDRIDRQLILLDWFFAQFYQWLPDRHVIRYERLIESRGQELATIVPAAVKLDEELISRNSSSLYKWDDMRAVFERLMQTEGAYWRFYSTSDAMQLFEKAGIA